MLSVEIKDNEKMVGILTATEKLFKTGSRGFFGMGDPDRREALPGAGTVGGDWLEAQARRKSFEAINPYSS